MLGKAILLVDAQRLAVEVAVDIKIFADVLGKLPSRLVIFIFGNSDEFCVVNPVHQVILIFKMIVKTLAVHLTPFTDVADADLLKGLGIHQLLERACQCLLCDVGICQTPHLLFAIL